MDHAIENASGYIASYGSGAFQPSTPPRRPQARLTLKEWAEAEGVSVNVVVVSVLEEFFNRHKKSKALRQQLRREIRGNRRNMASRMQLLASLILLCCAVNSVSI